LLCSALIVCNLLFNQSIDQSRQNNFYSDIHRERMRGAVVTDGHTVLLGLHVAMHVAYVRECNVWIRISFSAENIRLVTKARFPLPELTGRVDGKWKPVTRQLG